MIISNPNTEAVTLLCGTFGKESRQGLKPLTTAELNKLEELLHHSGLAPHDLLAPGLIQQADLEIDPEFRGRIAVLLERGASMAFAIEDWAGKGIQVMSRYDDLYPIRLKQRLGRGAPAILYTAGNMELLQQEALAIVGSRDSDNAAEVFATTLAEKCAADAICVVSGGARGVDSIAAEAAVRAGGCVIAILADSLARAAVSKANRIPLSESRMALISPYYPYAGFTVGNAMGRNRLIYSTSNWAVVVASSAGKGGTWAGAIENLNHRWVSLYVSANDPLPEGNGLLIERGAIPLNINRIQSAAHIRDILQRSPELRAGYQQAELF